MQAKALVVTREPGGTSPSIVQHMPFREAVTRSVLLGGTRWVESPAQQKALHPDPPLRCRGEGPASERSSNCPESKQLRAGCSLHAAGFISLMVEGCKINAPRSFSERCSSTDAQHSSLQRTHSPGGRSEYGSEGSGSCLSRSIWFSLYL